ncbi:MAG: FxsA family protein [Thermodesulfobacteriota bacterium]
MFIRLISIFILIPLIELVILIKVGSYIGLWPTILIVVLTGILGASLARYQGFMIINKIKSDVNSGRVPAQELIDGLLVLVGGIVLLTPGFLTDIFGFLLLIPQTRFVFKRFVKKHLQRYAAYKTSITIE